MTVANETCISSPLTVAVGAIYPVGFDYLDPTHLSVGVVEPAGNIFLFDLDQWSISAGGVTLDADVAALHVGKTLFILRDMPLVQPLELRAHGPWSPKRVERALDWLTHALQQLHERSTRAVTVAPGSETDANTILVAILEARQAAIAAAAAAHASALAAEQSDTDAHASALAAVQSAMAAYNAQVRAEEAAASIEGNTGLIRTLELVNTPRPAYALDRKKLLQISGNNTISILPDSFIGGWSTGNQIWVYADGEDSKIWFNNGVQVNGVLCGTETAYDVTNGHLGIATYIRPSVWAWEVMAFDLLSSKLANHEHTGSDGSSRVKYTNLDKVPTSFPPAVHVHDQGDIAGLVEVLAAKAGLVSPAFTGGPTAPTASPGDSSGQLATTEFVAAAMMASDAGSVYTFTKVAGDSNAAQVPVIDVGSDELGSILRVDVELMAMNSDGTYYCAYQRTGLFVYMDPALGWVLKGAVAANYSIESHSGLNITLQPQSYQPPGTSGVMALRSELAVIFTGITSVEMRGVVRAKIDKRKYSAW